MLQLRKGCQNVPLVPPLARRLLFHPGGCRLVVLDHATGNDITVFVRADGNWQQAEPELLSGLTILQLGDDGDAIIAAARDLDLNIDSGL